MEHLLEPHTKCREIPRSAARGPPAVAEEHKGTVSWRGGVGHRKRPTTAGGTTWIGGLLKAPQRPEECAACIGDGENLQHRKANPYHTHPLQSPGQDDTLYFYKNLKREGYKMVAEMGRLFVYCLSKVHHSYTTIVVLFRALMILLIDSIILINCL